MPLAAILNHTVCSIRTDGGIACPEAARWSKVLRVSANNIHGVSRVTKNLWARTHSVADFKNGSGPARCALLSIRRACFKAEAQEIVIFEFIPIARDY